MYIQRLSGGQHYPRPQRRAFEKKGSVFDEYPRHVVFSIYQALAIDTTTFQSAHHTPNQ
jgi:hypothetical protein